MISTICWYVDTLKDQLLEDMHNCTSLKSLMFKKELSFTCNDCLTQP